MMSEIDNRYPSIEDLRARARKRIPGFAFEYLDGGCNEDVNLEKNTKEIRDIELKPFYLRGLSPVSLDCDLFGERYSAPFGIAPVGLQGLMWPKSPEILATAAAKHNIPFILSTVSTSSIEKIAEITGGKMWFQLYHPADPGLTDDLLKRLEIAGVKVLVILCDVPSFGYRPRDIRNGLAMPPRMTLRNIVQILSRPEWALKTLMHGTPKFATMVPYMPKGLNMKQLGAFMNKTFSGRLDVERLNRLRDKWKGILVLKGVATEEDAAVAYDTGMDGIVISNHGGRQLDAGQSSIASLEGIAKNYRGKFPLIIDSGFRSGPDVVRGLAAGADFVLLGRTFMYSVAALGNKGGDHIIGILKAQIKQVMEQVGCGRVGRLGEHVIMQNVK